jgi:hypothetical protein
VRYSAPQKYDKETKKKEKRKGKQKNRERYDMLEYDGLMERI